MTSKSDLEKVKACARAMRYKVADSIGHLCVIVDENLVKRGYDPLTDAAQNAALDKVLLADGGYYRVTGTMFDYWRGKFHYLLDADMTKAENRYRARAECVAKLESEND